MLFIALFKGGDLDISKGFTVPWMCLYLDSTHPYFFYFFSLLIFQMGQFLEFFHFFRVFGFLGPSGGRHLLGRVELCLIGFFRARGSKKETFTFSVASEWERDIFIFSIYLCISLFIHILTYQGLMYYRGVLLIAIGLYSASSGLNDR